MTQPESEEDAFLKCQNGNCGKSFTRPLQALDMQAGSGEIYEACPYCLSKVLPSEAKTNVRIESVTSKTTTSCVHRFGFLYERSEKNQIPDECMMCKDLVPCMLKGFKE